MSLQEVPCQRGSSRIALTLQGMLWAHSEPLLGHTLWGDDLIEGPRFGAIGGTLMPAAELGEGSLALPVSNLNGCSAQPGHDLHLIGLISGLAWILGRRCIWHWLTFM